MILTVKGECCNCTPLQQLKAIPRRPRRRQRRRPIHRRTPTTILRRLLLLLTETCHHLSLFLRRPFDSRPISVRFSDRHFSRPFFSIVLYWRPAVTGCAAVLVSASLCDAGQQPDDDDDDDDSNGHAGRCRETTAATEPKSLPNS